MRSYKTIKNKQLFGTNGENQFEIKINQLSDAYEAGFNNKFDFIFQNDKILLLRLTFKSINQRPAVVNIFIEDDLDTIIITSSNRLNIFQFSTLNYLGSLDYQNYDDKNNIIYSPLSNNLAIKYGDGINFQLLDIWTPIFSNLYQNSLKSYQNRFIYCQDTNTILYANYNSNFLNVFRADNLQILLQLKFNQTLSATQYFVQLYRISVSTILAITSNRELLIYDFVLDKQIKYLSSSFNCILFSNYSQDIYCLENNNILKKFNYTLLDFSIIANQSLIQIQVSELYALSAEVLAFISFEGKMVILNPSTLQLSTVISLPNQTDKVYDLQNQNNLQNIRLSFQFNQTGYQILDFLTITYNQSNTLVIATTYRLFTHFLLKFFKAKTR
ncbi:hypothetical protein TTHERM_01328950 (macronuclear) [Tetrahymena thermophila SB210]|uniref:Uncharacterized protein n=1 Tax=Tetrahymena thermophila (strain SB210) TaxID=312017 RepID=Q23CQ8_TETTS|nr:hypothetical protein TTHERM_01328950 [Tetrahymena thermophila SB210]EAR94317.1 hypothetical protein TTHERM_01328950 [Tetrahymena thermophila SB210]|eukprot:XP_001014562.1 hypothetical protein TTHERM_01328950 [Tetrahymena thermophila SB210]